MVDTVAMVVGVVTLLIGVITFILTELDKRQRALHATLKEWQADTIAYIVDHSEDVGVTFEEVRAKYLAAANQNKEHKVPKALLQDEEIRRALFDLQSRGVIFRLNSGHHVCIRRADPSALKAEMEEQLQTMYGQIGAMLVQAQEKQEQVTRDLHTSMTQQLQKFFEIMQEMQNQQDKIRESDTVHREIQRSALEIAGRDPRRYNADQIAIDVMDKTKADRVIVMIQIISLIQSGILTQDDEGRVSIRLFNLPDPVLAPQ